MSKTQATAVGRSLSFSYIHSHLHCIFFSITFLLAMLVLFQLHVLKHPSLLFSPPPPSWYPFHHWGKVSGDPRHGNSPPKLNSTAFRPRQTVTFLPLKDLRFTKTAMEGNTWFMSSLNDSLDGDEAMYLQFPSQASNWTFLCLAGRDTGDGTLNSYALTSPENMPENATLKPGLTFVSDTYFDYHNIWHGLAAMLPFVRWHKKNWCVTPARWVLYHWGELRTSMGTWVQALMEATFGREVVIETFESGGGGGGGGPTCFAEAVVFRHNEGGMATEKRRETYDMMRCKARAYCNISTSSGDERSTAAATTVRITLYHRTGARSFKNESAVNSIFKKECEKIPGCQITISRANGLTFCDQVKLMSVTDVLVSPHGAQLTNMFLMDRNSSVMEFYPYGWLELAGVGQYVYLWIADWSGMRHQGAWREPKGASCPFNGKDRCFSFYKDSKVGHDATYFAGWAARVLKQVKEYKVAEASRKGRNQPQHKSSDCPCG